MLPLYPDAKLAHKSNDSNVGLWFERFFNQFNADASDISKPENGKNEQGNNFWLQKFKTAGDEAALQAAACRQMDLAKQLKGSHKFFNTQWHFVTGMGYPHPVENGLLWHPVHGVPYLSGAAVKGLVRAWVEEWAELEDGQKRQRLLAWFGSDHKESKEQTHPVQTGDLIFFDALPVKPVKLVTDIMTPHYGQWYSDGGKIKNAANEPEKVPADWHDPVPVPFLAVDQATSYLFSIAPRNGLAAGRVDMDEVIDCLTQALEWLGAGAKTATGYGGFNLLEKHPIEEKWLAATQSLEEKIQSMTEKKLIEAFCKNKDYLEFKTDFQEKGYEWEQVIALIWKHHENTITSWANSEKENTKKAYKKIMAEKE